MQSWQTELFFIITISIIIAIFTIYGRNISNNVSYLKYDFKNEVEHISKKINHHLQTESFNHEQLQIYLQNILNTHKYMSSITILSEKYCSCFCKKNKYEILDYKVYSDKKKERVLFPEWFTSELLKPRWTHPFYSNENSDRGYVLHYTINVIDPENGQADPIINISCSSKLRKRNDITITS